MMCRQDAEPLRGLLLLLLRLLSSYITICCSVLSPSEVTWATWRRWAIGANYLQRIYWQCYKPAFCFHRCSPLTASGVLPKRLTLKVDGDPQMVDRCRSSISWFSTCWLLLCLFHPTPVRWGLFYMHENYLLKGLSQGQRAHKIKGALELRSPAPECSEMGWGRGVFLGVKYQGRYNFDSPN